MLASVADCCGRYMAGGIDHAGAAVTADSQVAYTTYDTKHCIKEKKGCVVTSLNCACVNFCAVPELLLF